MIYLLHIQGGTILTQHGPFASTEAAIEYKWARDPRDEVSGNYDPEKHPLPVDFRTFDDPDSDTWVYIETGDDGRLHAETV